FAQSLDMRDAGFAPMLPGTSLVIFVCNDCLIAGEWQNCAALVWLPASAQILLKELGEKADIVQADQWYGPDNDNGMFDTEMWDELKKAEAPSSPPLWLSSSYGTKVGGAPFYLQSETVYYDRNGVAMEYIAQISAPEYISANGFGYVSHSTGTGETYL